MDIPSKDKMVCQQVMAHSHHDYNATFGLQCWSEQNTSIHGATTKAQIEAQMNHLEAEVQKIFWDHPWLAPRFPSPASLLIDTRLSCCIRHLQTWVQQILHHGKGDCI